MASFAFVDGRMGFSSVLLVILSISLQSTAYRVGDAVDVIYRTPSESMDALRHQMPVFGVPTVTNFQEDAKRFSLTFEDGGRPLPWIDIEDSKGRSLDEISVTFVYSISGVGAIHSMSSKTSYTSGGDDRSFRVRYEWVEEAPVNLASGTSVMLFACCIVSLVFIVQSCGQTEEGASVENSRNISSRAYGVPPGSTGVGGSVPKWD